MNPVVFHLVSGDAFFSGGTLLILGLILRQNDRSLFQRLASLATILGLCFYLLTAVPTNALEWGGQSAAVVLCLAAWLGFRTGDCDAGRHITRNQMLSVFSLLAVALSMGLELSWRFSPKFPEQGPRTLIILADSITAGIGENEAETWPAILQREKRLTVVDHSRMGATVGSELKWLPTREIPTGLILIELGGNDLLGGTTVPDFESALDQVLFQLHAFQNPVVMLELPIPPFYNRFGIAQRQLARKHGVQLIPKRELTRILAGNAATLDSIHLSQAGHHLMATIIWKRIQAAFIPDPFTDEFSQRENQ